MALIGTIRKNGWILILLMALALGGFILMDIISNSQRYQAGDANTLGKVNGTEIKRSEADIYEKLIYANQTNNGYQVRNQVWNYFVEKNLVEQVAAETGLGVCKDELMDLQFGENISPIIAERFRGDNGLPDRAQLSSIKAAIEGGQFTDERNRVYWSIQEKEVIKKRIEDKIVGLVTKAVYTPSWQAEMTFRDNNERVDFTYVRVGYDLVKDEEAAVTDADYKAFLADNPHLYDQKEETRVINFVSFDVNATKEDSNLVKNSVLALIEGFRTSTKDSQYVASHGGTYENIYKAKTALPAAAADTLLRMSIGSIVGPFLNAGSYSIAKIIDRKVVPDSVKARHILIRSATPTSMKTIDSLMNLINTGKGRFDSLATRFSQDQGSGAKGGDLGWFANGMMVAEFNDICFNTGEQGKLYKVATQFGWHLIEITGKKFIKNEASVKAAYISKPLEPSKETQQTIKNKAQALLQQSKTLEALNTTAGQQNLLVSPSSPLKANDFAIGVLGSGDDVREIVRWAFDPNTDIGDVSPQVFIFGDENGGFFDSRYVVAGLKSISPAGAATVASLKTMPDVQTKVINRKKTEVIKGKIQNPNDLVGIAAQFQTKVDTARGSTMLQGGSEPRMIGTAFSLAKGAVSTPIGGNSGVYIVSPISDKLAVQPPADLTMFRKQVSSTATSQIRANLLKSMIKAADIGDNRSRFY
jgi:peptidyl-prolyl cis-trans isomerase D